MNLSIATAFIIRTRGENIRCTAVSNNQNKWSGGVDLWKDGCFCKMLLSTNFNYDFEEEAIKDMKRLVASVRAMDLFDQKELEGLSNDSQRSD